jgi:hypothetical protein
MRCRLPLTQVRLIGRQLAYSLFLACVFRPPTLRQVASHRVHRATHFNRYPSQTQSVFPQYLDFHIHLVRNHRRLKSVYQFSIAGLYQFTSGGQSPSLAFALRVIVAGAVKG